MKQQYSKNSTFSIFGNIIPQKVIKQAIGQANKFLKEFGDDSNVEYFFKTEANSVLNEFINVQNLILSEKNEIAENNKYIIVGNIRMGYGHYRISIALASYANALGYVPLWLDLNSFDDTTASKIIQKLNKLYSLGSKLSQKYSLFNKFYWEPLNSEGFRKISYNAKDQKMTELMVSLHKNLPKTIPYVATHVWPAQAAVHSGFKKVVNIVPDNWPMGLHLAEGAIHAIQTFSAYLGYRTLNGMDKKLLKPMPKDAIKYTGHFIDYELLENLEQDTQNRLNRLSENKSLRVLITVGGAGAQQDLIIQILKYLLSQRQKITIFLNLGDHEYFLPYLKKELPETNETGNFYINEWGKTKEFAENALNNEISGLHIFHNKNIFEAVYSTNLLMRASDILITKPSELAFYPIPKLMIKRVGGHEAWGAIHAAEIGDGTIECQKTDYALQMLDLMINDKDILTLMNNNILKNKTIGIYDGAKNAIELAVK